ncbi:MAG TPA: hypothetical protein VM261_07050 [Kofleriaceae bacterium]|nr:hypothetical protein [Kofleriaceae bacterium]
MVRRLGAAMLAATLLTSTAARADQATLREARRVVEEEVRYDRAQELLVTALHQGDNSPEDLAAIYELAGVAAVVLGQREAGEQYFRRLLALRPAAKLPADTAPKILEPFMAAQAHMAAAGNLRVGVRAATASELVVDVAADPLGMVAGAKVSYRGGDGATGSVRGELPTPIAMTLPGGAIATSVEIVDEYGNRLQELPPPTAPVRRDGEGDRDRDRDRENPPPPGDEKPNIALRWSTWAIAAGVTGSIGLGFAFDGKRSHDRLDDILANPEDHFFGEAEDARRRWKRDTSIANVAFVATGVLAVGAVTVAIVMRDRGGAPKAALVPWLGDGAGLALVGTLP